MLKIILTIVVFFSVTSGYAAPSIEICRADGLFHISGLSDVGWDAITGGGGFEGDVLVVAPLADGTIQVLFWWTENDQDFMGELWGTAQTPLCDETDWQPSAPSIFLPLTSDCSFVDIRDKWGNYHRVESDGESVLLHYGQALIGSPSQSINPADYRVIPTECY